MQSKKVFLDDSSRKEACYEYEYWPVALTSKDMNDQQIQKIDKRKQFPSMDAITELCIEKCKYLVYG